MKTNRFFPPRIWLAVIAAVLANPTPTVTTAQEAACEIPWRDSRDISREAVQSAASRISSKGRQTIVLYDGDQALLDAIVKGGCASLAAGTSKLNGIILASGDQQEIAFYTSGTLTATLLNPTIPKLADDVVDGLANGLELNTELGR